MVYRRYVSTQGLWWEAVTGAMMRESGPRVAQSLALDVATALQAADTFVRVLDGCMKETGGAFLLPHTSVALMGFQGRGCHKSV